MEVPSLTPEKQPQALGGNQKKSSLAGKDLVALVDTRLSTCLVAKEANGITCCVTRSFTSRSREVIHHPCSALGYCALFCAPQ